MLLLLVLMCYYDMIKINEYMLVLDIIFCIIFNIFFIYNGEHKLFIVPLPLYAQIAD